MENQLGQWLKEQCKKENLSLRQVGKKAGLSHATVHSIIKGGHATAESVTRLAHAFSGDGNRRTALKDRLLILAGYRTQGSEISQTQGELLDIVRDFSESKLKVVIAFAAHLADIH